MTLKKQKPITKAFKQIYSMHPRFYSALLSPPTDNILREYISLVSALTWIKWSNQRAKVIFSTESAREGFRFHLRYQVTPAVPPTHDLPRPRKWRHSAWASIIWPALSMQPQPQSDVSVESGNGGKSVLYVSHTLEPKSFRKASTFPMTESSAAEAWPQSSGGLSSSEGERIQNTDAITTLCRTHWPCCTNEFRTTATIQCIETV